MFALSKILGLLLMPLGLLWLFLLVLALRAWRQQRVLAWALLGGFLFLGLAGNVHVGRRLVRALEQGAVVDDGVRLQAIFVHGGGTDVNPEGRPHLDLGGDRLAEAARLFQAGRAECLVAGGWGGGRDLGLETRRIWMELGVPGSAIRILEKPCLNTTQEVAAIRELARREGWVRVGLLSSASHLPRIRSLAAREGLEARFLGSNVLGAPVPFEVWDLVPRAEGLYRTERAAWERLGRVAGR